MDLGPESHLSIHCILFTQSNLGRFIPVWVNGSCTHTPHTRTHTHAHAHTHTHARTHARTHTHTLLQPTLHVCVSVYWQVCRYERLSPLVPLNHSLEGDIKNVTDGDCVVVFSRTKLYQVRSRIESATNKPCAVIYGGLPSGNCVDVQSLGTCCICIHVHLRMGWPVEFVTSRKAAERYISWPADFPQHRRSQLDNQDYIDLSIPGISKAHPTHWATGKRLDLRTVCSLRSCGLQISMLFSCTHMYIYMYMKIQVYSTPHS